jgi:hypothetical protein
MNERGETDDRSYESGCAAAGSSDGLMGLADRIFA